MKPHNAPVFPTIPHGSALRLEVDVYPSMNTIRHYRVGSTIAERSRIRSKQRPKLLMVFVFDFDDVSKQNM